MKNKSSKDERAKKKGFYYTLYGSLCVAIALAAVISVGQLTPNTQRATDNTALRDFDMSDLEPTGANTVRSYLDQIDQAAHEPAIAERNREPAPPPTPPAQPRENDGADNLSVTSPPVPRQNDQPETPEQPQPDEPQASVEPEEPAFEAFAEGATMIWPLVGEVIMPFSMDALVYDRTLDQFRTNDSISIAAAAGTQVRAAADGIVISVKNTREQGNVIVVDNGNGWTTTYSQLQDGVLVEEGDVVRRSQVIGGVGNPSIFSVLLGNHLEFRVARDDVAKNPLDLLAD